MNGPPRVSFSKPDDPNGILLRGIRSREQLHATIRHHAPRYARRYAVPLLMLWYEDVERHPSLIEDVALPFILRGLGSTDTSLGAHQAEVPSLHTVQRRGEGTASRSSGGFLDRVKYFLGIEWHYPSPPGVVNKVHTATHAHQITNYAQVATALQKAGLERYLRDELDPRLTNQPAEVLQFRPS